MVGAPVSPGSGAICTQNDHDLASAGRVLAPGTTKTSVSGAIRRNGARANARPVTLSPDSSRTAGARYAVPLSVSAPAVAKISLVTRMRPESSE